MSDHRFVKLKNIQQFLYIAEKQNKYRQIAIRHTLFTDNAINIAINYCNDDVKELVFPLKEETYHMKKKLHITRMHKL